MRKILRSLAMLSVGSMIVLTMWPAHAATEGIPFACDEYLISLDFSGARGKDTGSGFYGRGAVATLQDVGTSEELGVYCQGTDIVVGNTNQNLITGVGQLWGTFRYDLEAFPGSGFDGTFHERFIESLGSFAGEGVANGYGELEGWQMRMSILELNQDPNNPTAPSTRVWGYVFSPGV